MSIIQILILLFAVFAISRAVRQFRHGALTILWLILWIVFWFVVAGVTLSPQTTDTIAKIAGVGRGADFVIYISLIALFYLVFRLFVKIEDVEQEITKLVRKIAMEEKEEKEEKEVGSRRL